MTRNSTPPRNGLTAHLKSTVSQAALIYAYEKEDSSSGGWTDDPAKPTSRYIPYSTITPLTANEPSGSIGDAGAIWQLPYSLRTFGASGTQVERQSDKVRKLLSDMERSSILLGDEEWTIMKVTCPVIGGVNINRSTARATFEQYDTVLVWISKEL